MKQEAPENRVWTTPALATVATGFVIYWLGLTFRNNQLTVASAILLTFVALAVAFSAMPSDELSVNRQILPDRTTEENIVTIRTSIQNRTRNRFLVYLTEILPKNIEIVEGSQTDLIVLEPSSGCEIRNALKPKFRGHFVLPPAYAELTDDFGLRVKRTSLGKPVYLSVLPPVEDLSSFPLETKSSQPEIGAFRSGSVGVGTEFFGIRDYLPGDEFRHINWKASARHSSLLSNEYEREHVTNIYLLVDLTSENLTHLKWITRAASSLATYLLKTRNRLGLIVIGESVSHVKIEGGRRQLLRVIDKLMTAEPGGTGELSIYLQHTMDQLPPCEFIIITTLTNESFVRTLMSLYQRRERASVVTLSEAERPSKDLVLETARLIRTLKRRATVMRIRNSGIRVIELPAGQPLTVALPGLRERPVRR
jgi:uncharacterized protein (DUF58 family)